MTAPALVLATAASLALALWPSLPDLGMGTSRGPDAESIEEGPRHPAAPGAAPDAAPTPTPTPTLDEAMAYVDGTAMIPWNALSEADWAVRSTELLEGYEAVHEQLEPPQLLRLFAQLGRSAENANSVDPRFYGELDGTMVNRPFAAAASVAKGHPGLLDEVITDDAMRASIEAMVERMASGDLPSASHREIMTP